MAAAGPVEGGGFDHPAVQVDHLVDTLTALARQDLQPWATRAPGWCPRATDRLGATGTFGVSGRPPTGGVLLSRAVPADGRPRRADRTT